MTTAPSITEAIDDRRLLGATVENHAAWRPWRTILCAGGYEMTRVEPLDQFRHTPRVEIVAAFLRRVQDRRRNRRLLG